MPTPNLVGRLSPQALPFSMICLEGPASPTDAPRAGPRRATTSPFSPSFAISCESHATLDFKSCNLRDKCSGCGCSPDASASAAVAAVAASGTVRSLWEVLRALRLRPLPDKGATASVRLIGVPVRRVVMGVLVRRGGSTSWLADLDCGNVVSRALRLIPFRLRDVSRTGPEVLEGLSRRTGVSRRALEFLLSLAGAALLAEPAAESPLLEMLLVFATVGFSTSTTSRQTSGPGVVSAL